ncbi:MAG: C4-dicarboxylate ABC transporter permease [Burkholderiales bacterium RIFCSPHIGHO2_12_FULL_69_20]|nr:MAG: C4-dicarboxylate ABC transporter permease [Burkholderiales bacterium RIFCSPHIGHO2_12_FULL_69_20]
MIWLGLLLLIVVLLMLRQSLVLVFAVAAAYIHVLIADSKLEYLLQDFWFTVDREVLLSIPLFILAGNVMSRGSIAVRLIDFMKTVTSPIPGGLGIACVLSCAAFAAINGSSIVTMLAIGSIMYPAMVSQGYSKPFALGAVASAGTLGIIIPPSIPLILYGIMTEKNIAHLFVAGIGPGLLLTLMFSGYSLVINRNIPRQHYSLGDAGRSFGRGVFALALPVIIIGGIYSGKFSPTESAAVALAYALLIEFLVHRRDEAPAAPSRAGPGTWLRHYLATRAMNPRELVDVVLETTRLLATLLPLLCIAGSLNTILDHSGAPKEMVQYLVGAVDNRWLMMLGINLLLLLVGCLMDVGSAILILAPLLQPLAEAKGFDPIHFGIIMISNLELGYLTPPVGLNLIVAMAAFKVSFATVCKAVVPFMLIMVAWLTVVVTVPLLSLFLIGQ